VATHWRNLPAADGDGYVELDIISFYYFVKINNNLDALLDGIPRTVQTTPFPLVAVAIQADDSAVFSPTAQVMAHMPTLTFAQRTCTTPFTNTVKLPTVNAADLDAIAVGDSLPPTDFWITMNCPRGLAAVGYYVTDVHGFENEAQGVIKINPASQAKGIGLRITTRSRPSTGYWVADGLNPNYQPVTFGPGVRYLSYDNINSTIDGDPLNDRADYRAHNNAIPLQVAIYRVGAVVPGTFNAAIYIHLVYR